MHLGAGGAGAGATLSGVSLARALGALLLLTAGSSHAQVEGPSRITLAWDNDLLAGTDRHYTNGARVELSGRLDPRALPGWLAADEARWGLAAGQHIYTPEDLEAAEPAADDRPYAGLSYVALSVNRRVAALGLEDRIELSLGVVGPSSGAQAVHRLAHEVFGSEKARGWCHGERRAAAEPREGKDAPTWRVALHTEPDAVAALERSDLAHEHPLDDLQQLRGCAMPARLHAHASVNDSMPVPGAAAPTSSAAMRMSFTAP